MNRALEWRKSSQSAGNGACVEIATHMDGRLIRDSKDPDGPWLGVHNRAWGAFLDDISRGGYDLE